MIFLNRFSYDVEEINRHLIAQEAEKFSNDFIVEIKKESMKHKSPIKKLRGEKVIFSGLRESAGEEFKKNHDIHDEIDDLENSITDYRDFVVNFGKMYIEEDKIPTVYQDFVNKYRSFKKRTGKKLSQLKDVKENIYDAEFELNLTKLELGFEKYTRKMDSDVERLKKIISEKSLPHQTGYI